MDKKIFSVYLAKLDTPDSEVQTRLELPASPWELHDAMDKVQLQENEELYLEVDDYYGFEYLAPHLDGSDISLNELNKLARQLAALDEVQGIDEPYQIEERANRKIAYADRDELIRSIMKKYPPKESLERPRSRVRREAPAQEQAVTDMLWTTPFIPWTLPSTVKPSRSR